MPALKTKSQSQRARPSPRAVDAWGWDLLAIKPVRRFMVSRWYPGAFQAISLVLFGMVVYFGLFSTIRPAYNFATAVTWNLWWPLLPLSLVLMGRMWCTICPLVPPIELAQRLANPTRMPGQFLRRYGVWLMGLTFIFVTWANRMWSIISSPRATALLLLALLGLAVVVAVLYKRRAFCRYICPIGTFTGLYAMTAAVELRSNSAATCDGCKGKECYRGSDTVGGCPLYQYTRTMDSNRNCNLCGQCIKSCPHGAVELRLRTPGRELWLLGTPLLGEAFLVMMLVVVVYMQTADMTTAWADYMRWLLGNTALVDYNLAFTLTFVAAILAVMGIYLLVTRWASAPGAWRRNFAAFGYAYIPLILAVHLGHNFTHLVSEGPKALSAAFWSVLNPLGTATAPVQAAGIPMLNQAWMVPLVLLGGTGSLYTAWRISQKPASGGGKGKLLPHLIFLLVLTVLFVQLFLLPMNLRHAH